MDEIERYGLVTIVFLLAGIGFLGVGMAFWKSAWLLILVGIACFIGMFVYMSWLLKRIEVERREVLYKKGESRREKERRTRIEF